MFQIEILGGRKGLEGVGRGGKGMGGKGRDRKRREGFGSITL